MIKKIFYRGKHAKKHWWQFWKKSDDKERKDAIENEIQERVEAFKFAFEQKELSFCKKILSIIENIDTARLIRAGSMIIPGNGVFDFEDLCNAAAVCSEFIVSQNNLDPLFFYRYFMIFLLGKEIPNYEEANPAY